MRVFSYKEVTRRCLEDLELKGGDGGACKVLGWLLGDVMVMQGSLQALSDLHNLFSGFMDYFWSCTVGTTPIRAKILSALLTIKCLKWCCLDTGMVTVIVGEFYQW
ncbi:hypothetical protein Tco_1240745 [Tanacetum coccineum]